MKNTLKDLNDHLFAEIERLGDEDLDGEKLEEEIKRASAMAGIAGQIVNNGALILKAIQIKENSMSAEFTVPRVLSGGE